VEERFGMGHYPRRKKKRIPIAEEEKDYIPSINTDKKAFCRRKTRPNLITGTS